MAEQVESHLSAKLTTSSPSETGRNSLLFRYCYSMAVKKATPNFQANKQQNQYSKQPEMLTQSSTEKHEIFCVFVFLD